MLLPPFVTYWCNYEFSDDEDVGDIYINAQLLPLGAVACLGMATKCEHAKSSNELFLLVGPNAGLSKWGDSP
jgi:hypothetical protein